MLDLLLNGRVGVFLLDRWGHIVEANDCARAMLRARNILSDHGGWAQSEKTCLSRSACSRSLRR